MTEAVKIDLATATRLFIASAPIHMCLLDLEGRVVEVSPIFVEQSGIARDQIVGQFIDDLIPGGGESLGATQERLVRGEAVVEIQRTVTVPDGRVRHVRTQASGWRDDAGALLGVVCLNQDITPEMEANAARLESEAQLRAVVDNLPAQLALLDLETRHLALINARFPVNRDFDQSVNIGRRYDEMLTPTRRAWFEDIIAKTEAAGGAFEMEQLLDEGSWAGHVARMKTIVFEDARGARKLLWICEDVTELRRAHQALEQAAADAEAANRAKSEFLANMSHEIRTPLNGVMGVAGALARTQLTPAQHEMVSLIETSGRTLETLLSDILDLARIEAGKMEIRPEPFDLATSVNASAALFDAAAQAKGLDLEVEIAPQALGAYVGDAARLRQVLSNLLGNAVKFTPVGRVRLVVDAARGETSSTLRFEVSDTGIGFDDETKIRLFSRFEQADGSITRRFGGSGLGLSISRSLADAMGGRLEGDASPGEGAVFTLVLELPRAEGAPDLWCEGDEPEAQPDPLVGMRVLLAEDHPTNRRVVELILGAAGVDLTCVENGVEAVDAFRRGVFDLVLMDMQMPLLDGLSAIVEIRKLEAAAGAAPTPIHVLTANAMPEHISASIEAGADGHLSKPILADALLERVAEATAARAAPVVAPQRLRPSGT